ncbi:unnamed protein product [Symbiodinium sp. CCMP2592]|nr:unnamed protein product [Symbiodinium sp. CCMP2592]
MAYRAMPGLYRDIGKALDKLLQQAQGELSIEGDMRWERTFRQLESMVSDISLGRQQDEKLITTQGIQKLQKHLRLAWKCRRQAARERASSRLRRIR